jgi:hypothetical protein
MNPYDVLGVAPDADEEIIKAAYRVRARQRHPDRGGSDAEMKSVNAAHEVLLDPKQRAVLDLDLARDRAASASRTSESVVQNTATTTRSGRGSRPMTPAGAPPTQPAGPEWAPMRDPRSHRAGRRQAERAAAVKGPRLTPLRSSPIPYSGSSPSRFFGFPHRNGGSVTVYVARVAAWILTHLPTPVIAVMMLFGVIEGGFFVVALVNDAWSSFVINLVWMVAIVVIPLVALDLVRVGVSTRLRHAV